MHAVLLGEQHHVHYDLKRRGLVAVVLHHVRDVSERPIPRDLLLLEAAGFVHPPLDADEGIVVVELDALDMTAVEHLSNEGANAVDGPGKIILLRS